LPPFSFFRIFPSFGDGSNPGTELHPIDDRLGAPCRYCRAAWGTGSCDRNRNRFPSVRCMEHARFHEPRFLPDRPRHSIAQEAGNEALRLSL
jgi:hypothetical protein